MLIFFPPFLFSRCFSSSTSGASHFKKTLFTFFPRYVFHIRDLAEGFKSSMVKSGNCMTCTETADNLGDFEKPMILRRQRDLEKIMNDARLTLTSGDHGCITAAQDQLHRYLLKPCYAEVCGSFMKSLSPATRCSFGNRTASTDLLALMSSRGCLRKGCIETILA